MKRKLIGLTVMLTIGALAFVSYRYMDINTIGLRALTSVKTLLGNSVDLGSLEEENTPTVDHQAWTLLLQQHVDESGMISYTGFQQDHAALSAYLEELTQHPPAKSWSQEEKLAYWINAYNAFTIKLILDHYPLSSIKDIRKGLPMINSPWDIKFFKIGETDMDLNTIEHEILRKQFAEPRIHFAINCASISCPKLRTEAYTPQQLETQLEEQAKGFIHNPEKNTISDTEIRLSKVFDWFKVDFTREMDLLDYINRYKAVPNPELPVEYMEYDWSLNE